MNRDKEIALSNDFSTLLLPQRKLPKNASFDAYSAVAARKMLATAAQENVPVIEADSVSKLSAAVLIQKEKKLAKQKLRNDALKLSLPMLSTIEAINLFCAIPALLDSINAPFSHHMSPMYVSRFILNSRSLNDAKKYKMTPFWTHVNLAVGTGNSCIVGTVFACFRQCSQTNHCIRGQTY